MSEEDNNKAIADKVFNAAMDGVVRALTDDQIAAFHELIKARAPQIIAAQESLWRLAHAVAREVEERAFRARAAAQGDDAAAVARILTHKVTA